MKSTPVILPMIRKLMPAVMAHEESHRPPPFKFVSTVDRQSTVWYHVRAYHVPVMQWIVTQDPDLWIEQYGRLDQSGYFIDGKQYVLHEQLYTIFAMKWSS